MAVMTSQHPEGVALEQKTQPVPSSGEMALDLEINGTSNRDETIDDTHASEPVEENLASSDVAVNGSKNNDAFASNAATTGSESFQPSLESQATQSSSLPAESPPTPQTKSTTQEHTSTEHLPTSAEQSTLLESADAAIDSAIGDIAAQTSVPPVVEAQESDLRDLAPPAQLPSESRELQDSSVELGLDVVIDSSSAQPSLELAESSTAAEAATVSPEQSSSSLPLEIALAQTDSLPPPDLNPGLDLPPQTEPDLDSSLNVAMDITYDAPPAEATPQVDDIQMDDAPQVDAALEVDTAPHTLGKVRGREDDDENGPAAKRTKTEENGESTDHGIATNSSPQLTPHEVKEIIKILKNSARTTDGKHFNKPVLEAFPGLRPQYEALISQPMDLGTMERKLKENAYATMDDVKADIDLFVNNAVTFNKEAHPVTQSGFRAREALFKKLANIPPEPTPAPKKEKKVKPSTHLPDRPAKDTAARRPSRGAGTDASATFALNPETNLPLIRRDSTKLDGDRPKRAIVPPKNKDLPYSVKPKSRKFDTELKWCSEVLTELMKPRYQGFASAFYHPVDPVALGIPTYFNVIKTPMDLSTVKKKLEGGEYANSKEFEKDVGLIFSNCYKFNPPPNIVNAWGKQLEEIYRAQLAKKTQWINDHSPRSHSATPDSDEEESEEETENAPAVSNAASLAMNQRLVEEQAKLIEMMNDKSADPALIQMQRDMVQVVKTRAEAEAAALAQASAAAKKPKKSKPSKSKKAPPVKKAAAKKSGQKRYLGTFEKETISAGIGALPEQYAEKVLEMIRENTVTEADEDGNVELDIEVVPTPILWKIFDMVVKHAPEVPPEVRRQIDERDAPRELARPAQKKKNKPMSSTEQEAKIQQLRSVVQDYERQESGSQEPLPTVEHESSGDDSSDSEED